MIHITEVALHTFTCSNLYKSACEKGQEVSLLYKQGTMAGLTIALRKVLALDHMEKKQLIDSRHSCRSPVCNSTCHQIGDEAAS